jgi:type IV conjugative transfer system coupling protein TraD
MNNNDNKNMKNFTRGGQITFHNLRMWFQVNNTVWNIYFASLVILIIFSIYIITPNEILQNAWYWCLAQINPVLELLDFKIPRFNVPYHGRIYNIAPKNYLSYVQFVKTAEAIISYLKIGAIIGSILSLGVFYSLVKWLMSKGEDQTTNGFIRGSRLDTVKNVAKQIKKRKLASDIVIDDMPMIAGSEVRHFLVHGATGTGKTQLISKFLDHLRRREDKVVVYDMGGVYTSTFYRRGRDKILNPLDARSEDWDLWREAREDTDFASLAASLIPRPTHADPYWADSARAVFANVAYTMQDENDRSVKKMLKFLLTAPLEELYRYLADTEAAALVSDKIEKTSLSIRSVMTTYTKSLKFLTGLEQTQKPKFCIKDWLNDKDKKDKNDEWLFITSTAGQHEALRPLVSMWFSMATIALMNSTSQQGRVWFVCDELPSMHQLPQLTTALAQGRKYGGCFILGMQNYAQLETIYARSGAESIFDNIHTRFFFRSPSSQMAELVSRELGSQEVQNIQETYSYGANSIRDGITLGSQKMINQLVTPSEIMDLETMNCYLRLAGAYPITKLSLNFEERPTTEPGFILGNVKPDQEISSLVDSFGSKVRKVPPQETKTEQKEEKEKQVEEKHPKDGNTQNTANSSGSFADEPQVENAPEKKTQGLFKDW